MEKVRSVLLVGVLLAANLVFLFSETSGDRIDPWGECGMECIGPGECEPICFYMFVPDCEGTSACPPPAPEACEECV